MKQFKNKFTGDVATFTNESGYKLNSEVIGLIPAKYIENSNDWEEVKEEIYQILSFKYRKSLVTLRNKGTYIIDTAKDSDFPGFSLVEQLREVERGICQIHSVKRLSDGEIFTIGDNINRGKHWEGEKTLINSFHFSGERLRVSIKQGSNMSNYPFDNIMYKDKKILFTSCDGVEIFEGQNWWYVAHDKMVAKETDTLVYRGRSRSKISSFSTREKAEQWIHNNRRPNFITDDGVKIFPGDKYWSVNPKTLSMWEATCNNGTQKNGDNKVFSNECNAKKYYMFDAPVLSLNDVASIYLSASKEVTNRTPFSAQNRRIQNLVLSKLTNHGKQKY